jgi:hypothetical protein
MARGNGIEAVMRFRRRLTAWEWLRTFAITGWLVSITVAVVLSDPVIRGYGTAWAAVTAVLAWLYMLGMLRFSRTWRRDMGAVIFVLVAQIAMVMTTAWLTRVYLSPPANPNVGNAILYINLAWTLFWLLALFVRWQLKARREIKERNGSAR